MAEQKQHHPEFKAKVALTQRTQNIEYALLKAHRIIENAIEQYIRGYASVAVTHKDVRFSFDQKFGNYLSSWIWR